MKPKTKLFLSLLWRDVAGAGRSLLDFYVSIVPIFLSIFAVAVLGSSIACMELGEPYPKLLTWIAAAYLSVACFYSVVMWATRRWDQLPDKTP